MFKSFFILLIYRREYFVLPQQIIIIYTFEKTDAFMSDVDGEGPLCN